MKKEVEITYTVTSTDKRNRNYHQDGISDLSDAYRIHDSLLHSGVKTDVQMVTISTTVAAVDRSGDLT